MNYTAKKIYLTCSEAIVREWAEYMTRHADEVRQALRQESVRHEMWLLGREATSLYLIGIMDVGDPVGAHRATQQSTLSVDRVHKQFKAHWDPKRISDVPIDRNAAPTFPGLEVLWDARPTV